MDDLIWLARRDYPAIALESVATEITRQADEIGTPQTRELANAAAALVWACLTNTSEPFDTALEALSRARTL